MERGVFGQDENARGGERDGMREDDAGFAALDATEPFFGSSPAQNFGGAVSGTDGFSGFESADGGIAAHGGFEPLTFEAPTAPAELGAFEALAFEAPAPLAEPVLDWGAPQYASAEPDAPAVPRQASEVPVSQKFGAQKSGAQKPVEQKPGANRPAKTPPEASPKTSAPQASRAVGSEPKKPAQAKPAQENVTRKNVAPRKVSGEKTSWKMPVPEATEEFPDWHPAAHGFREEPIARNLGDDYPGYFPVPAAPLEPAPGGGAGQGSEESSEGSPRRSLRVDPNLPAVSIDEAPVRAFTPGGAEPRPMAAGRMSRAGAASIGSGLTAEEKEEIERQAQQREKQQKKRSNRQKPSEYKRGFRRMSPAQREKMQKRSPYAPAFGARSEEEETCKSPAGRSSGSNLFREGSSLNEKLTAAEEAFIRGIAEEEAQGVGTGKRPAAPRASQASGVRAPRKGGNGSAGMGGQGPSWKQKVRADRAAEEADPYTRAKTIVYNQLAYSAKTRGQLRKKLQAEGFEAELIEPLLDKFEAAKLIDDAEYAETFVRQKSRTKKLSRAALRRELAERGVRGEEAENALAQRTDEQEREDAAELVRKKLRPGMDLSDRAEKDRVTRRLLGMLARRGYSSSVSMSVIREELAAYGAEDDLW
ncbi:MAG: RecX family transcriptional regulator [Rothia sp.]|uniref:RecX family transcriptional regulator n=1 Tax=Rothia sp. (in: high G+C Gram-positive bacteria) TaxID=1885016 RepID=UPI001CAE313B|nr:RecX family transcriptional regulator [Rothia sp. (in: high G+C Gram-positive bacteria)]MBF1676225.1 RecX family transcriptional regulator [Rothia sp. (in: high G+C Gram-positive bacteria)]